jgi:hypothetical protein
VVEYHSIHAVRAGAQLRVGERHPGGQDPDANLAGARPGIVLLDDLQDLGLAYTTRIARGIRSIPQLRSVQSRNAG